MALEKQTWTWIDTQWLVQRKRKRKAQRTRAERQNRKLHQIIPLTPLPLTNLDDPTLFNKPTNLIASLKPRYNRATLVHQGHLHYISLHLRSDPKESRQR
jgi:hypothetical protein